MYLHPGSQFDVSADVTAEVLGALKAHCSPISPSGVLAAVAAEPSPEVFDATRLLIQDDILRGRYGRLVGYMCDVDARICSEVTTSFACIPS